MSQVCSVCRHHEREAINAALVAAGASLRDIAGQYNLSKSAVERHKAEHLPAIMVKSHAVREVAHADHLLAEANRLYQVATRIMEQAEERKPDTALRAIQAAGRVLALLAELMGEINRAPVVNVLVSPEWIHVRSCLMRALGDFPEARAAAALALTQMDTGDV